MTKKSQDARVVRSQNSLLKSGMELLNSNREATLSDIAQHAGVGRTTLYRQFESRDTLIDAIATYCLETMEAATMPIEHEATSALDAIRLLFLYVMPMRAEFEFLMNLGKLDSNNPEFLAIEEKHEAEVTALIDEAKRDGDIDSDLPSEWVYHVIEGLFVAGWLQQEGQQSDAGHVAALAFRSFCLGVRKKG